MKNVQMLVQFNPTNLGKVASSILLMLGVAAIATTGEAVAQEESTADASTPIEQIVVTGRRREELLQEIPESMKVFDSTEIERAGIDRLNDFAALTPNLHFFDDQEVGVGTITIRGITQNRGTGEAPVAFVVDGVPIANSFLTTQDLFDVEQIEVLRGPQGALYGRNSIGGAINITTKAPTNDPEFQVRITAQEGDDNALRASASGPIVEDRLLVRASASIRDREGQLRNQNLGELVDFNESQAARLRVLYQGEGSFTGDFRAQYSNQEGGSGYFIPTTVAGDDPFELPVFNTTGTIQANILGKSSVEFYDLTARLDFEFDSGTLTSITSYNEVTSDNDQDLDMTSMPVINITADDEAEMISQELRFVSESSRRFRYLFGVYAQKEDRLREIRTRANAPCLFLALTCEPQDAFFVDVPPSISDTTSTLVAAFTQINYDLTDDLELTVALRYDSDERENRTINAKETFSDLQPKVSLAYQLSEDALLYATYSEGFRSGGFNNIDPATSPFAAQFDAEELKNYEIGFNSAWGANRLILNGALFYIDYDDQQFFLFNANGEQALVNAPSTEILGGELEFVFNATDNLTFHGGYGFVDSEIKSFNQVPGLLVPAENIVGKKVPNAPVASFNLVTQYETEMANDVMFVGRLEYEWRDTTYFTIDNGNPQDSYGLVNLRLTLAKELWSVTLFGNNLFDEEYQEWFFASRFVGLPTDLAWPNRPRQYGIEISFRF